MSRRMQFWIPGWFGGCLKLAGFSACLSISAKATNGIVCLEVFGGLHL